MIDVSWSGSALYLRCDVCLHIDDRLDLPSRTWTPQAFEQMYAGGYVCWRCKEEKKDES